MSKIKKIIKFLRNEFVFGGYLVALGAPCIVFTVATLSGIKITWDCLLVVYLGTQAVYLYNYYKEFEKDAITNPERVKHIEKYLKFIPLIIVLSSFVAIAIVVWSNKILALIFSLLLLGLGFLYSLFLKKITERIIGFKSFFVTLIWTSLVLLVALYYSAPWNLALILTFLFIFLRELINPNFCDLKDVESDQKENLLTLAVVFGKEKLIYFLGFINILSGLPIIIGSCLGIFPRASLMLLLIIPYTFYYLKKSQDKEANTVYLYSILPDGEYLLWIAFILLGKFLL